MRRPAIVVVVFVGARAIRHDFYVFIFSFFFLFTLNRGNKWKRKRLITRLRLRMPEIKNEKSGFPCKRSSATETAGPPMSKG